MTKFAQIKVALLLYILVIPSLLQAQQSCPEPSGSSSIDRYCYDALGRLIAQTHNDGIESAYNYDDAGNRLIASTDGARTSIIIFNLNGRPTPIVVPPN